MLTGRPALPYQTEIGAGCTLTAGSEYALCDTSAADCLPPTEKPTWRAPHETSYESQ